MSNVITLKRKDDKDPWDDMTMCVVTVFGDGKVELIVNAEIVETADQHNWVISKLVEAGYRLIGRKNEILDGEGA
jgi:hypothetical protein